MAATQPADDDIDLSDIPEVRDFSRGVRGKYHPRVLALEAELRRLRAALEQIVWLADANQPRSVPRDLAPGAGRG